MRLAVTTAAPDITQPIPVSLLTGSFEARLDKAAAMDYDGVELIVNQPGLLNAQEIRRAVGQRRLELAAIASGGQASQEGLTLLATNLDIERKALERLKELIRFAGECEAAVVTVGSFRGRAAADGLAEGRRRLATALHDAAEAAEKYNIHLTIEPLNRYETNLIQTIAEGCVFIEEIDHPHIGLLLDTFHANIEEVRIADAIQTALTTGKLFHVHLGDSNRLATGWGHIDFREIFTALEHFGYAGFCSAELLAKPDGDLAARQTIEYCRKFR